MNHSEKTYLRLKYKRLIAQRTNPILFVGKNPTQKLELKTMLTAQIMLLEELFEKFQVEVTECTLT